MSASVPPNSLALKFSKAALSYMWLAFILEPLMCGEYNSCPHVMSGTKNLKLWCSARQVLLVKQENETDCQLGE